MTFQVFDHYSPQTHESVTAFLSNWGKKPWDDMNVPIGLHLLSDETHREAIIQVFHPRKEHVKSVTITIRDDAELQALRDTFKGIAEALYEPAATNLERFAAGYMPEHEDDASWGGIVLYYWNPTDMYIG